MKTRLTKFISESDYDAETRTKLNYVRSSPKTMTPTDSRPMPLSEKSPVNAPPTEGIKYAGSKLKLLPHILQLAAKVNAKSVFDGFAGSTRVSQAFAQTGYRVVANDISVWSEVFGVCYLLNSHPVNRYAELFNHLNALPEKDGWFTEHYGGDCRNRSSAAADGFKKPWQTHNTRKLDAIREEIEVLPLDKCEKAVALTSLILALDAVDSTIGHYASYLNEWSPRSFNRLCLKVPRLINNRLDNEIYRGDVFDVLPKVATDLAYYDPPYGSNNEKMPPSRVRYSAYYHLWTSIVLFDQPELFGKVKRRIDSSDKTGASEFEEFRRNDDGKFIAVVAIERLLEQTVAEHIILSYSTNGRATAEELTCAVAKAGKLVEVVEIDYKRNVMGAMRWTHDWVREAEGGNRELLFLISK
jgi:adenine-specific DNA-methyltransferase